jgi:hypothetical protein
MARKPGCRNCFKGSNWLRSSKCLINSAVVGIGGQESEVSTGQYLAGSRG